MNDEQQLPGFRELGLSAPILEALAAVGYETPSPIQAQTIPLLLSGSDLLGQAQTGTGKTAAFALPVLAQIDLPRASPQALVLVPTRELAIQVAEAFQRYAARLKGFHVLPIYGGQSYVPQLKGLKRGMHVVVGTPGRIMDHMKRGALKLDTVRFIVLDEGDEMLQMGFVDAIEWILEQAPPQRQIALFSATLPPRSGESHKNTCASRRRSRSRIAPAPRRRFGNVIGRSAACTSSMRSRGSWKRNASRPCSYSCGRSWKQRSSPSGSRRAASTSPPCTAISLSSSANARSPGLRRDRSTSSSRPTSLREAWTLNGFPTSSTMTFRTTRRRTFTGSVARAAPVATGRRFCSSRRASAICCASSNERPNSPSSGCTCPASRTSMSSAFSNSRKPSRTRCEVAKARYSSRSSRKSSASRIYPPSKSPRRWPACCKGLLHSCWRPNPVRRTRGLRRTGSATSRKARGKVPLRTPTQGPTHGHITVPRGARSSKRTASKSAMHTASNPEISSAPSRTRRASTAATSGTSISVATTALWISQ